MSGFRRRRNKISMKKMLMVAAVPSMIGQFNMENIRMLLDMGYEVHVACNFYDISVWPKEIIREFICRLKELGVNCHQIEFSRSPKDLKSMLQSYWQIDRLLKSENFWFVHCHTPLASVISRMVCNRNHVKVIYTAHGFHFYKGGPLKNWLLYYPIEKWMSRYTDVLIVINKEDYRRAKKKFYMKKVVYIPGVGVDTKKYAVCQVNREKKRQELGIENDNFVLLSVGELQSRKNQKIVIEALHKLNNSKIIYLLVGRGELEGEYRRLIRSYGLEKNIKLLGFRSDIDELCKAADCFIHPSVREGFGIAPMEAMASGLPLISADVNGIRDYAENGVTGICVNPVSENEVADAVNTMFVDEEFRKRCGKYNAEKAKKYDIGKTNKIMKKLYQNILYGREKWI